MKFFRIVAPDLAIDLGTGNTVVARLDKGIIVNEPTVVALDFKRKEIMAIGEEAKELMGRTPDNIACVKPLEDGVISDFDLTQALLEHYINKAVPGISLLAPRLTISVPSGATDVEYRAIQDACLQAGARDVYLVEETLASGYGSGMITDSSGAMIVNIGSGTSEVAVVSNYGVITSQTLQHGGDYLDNMIMQVIRDRYEVMIGKNVAEQIKKELATFRSDQQKESKEVSGRDLETGLPKTIDVYVSDVLSAMIPFANELIDIIRLTLEKTPPELSYDIMKKGILLTGGGALIDGLGDFIQPQLQIPTFLSEHPLLDTIYGTQYIMKNINKIKNKRS